MSTRSVIARKTGAKSFSGVYHHWDGYPSGLGATLFEVRNKHFKGDTQALLNYLIDKHPQGWSTINGADFSLPSGTKPNTNILLCRECYRPIWAHYKQYYTESNPEWVRAGKPSIPLGIPDGVYRLFEGCSGLPFDRATGPECFGKDEDTKPITEMNAGGMGCEYAYVFDGNGTMEILASYCPEGGKMIGMFGLGDPESEWKVIGIVDLDGKEPNWESIEA